MCSLFVCACVLRMQGSHEHGFVIANESRFLAYPCRLYLTGRQFFFKNDCIKSEGCRLCLSLLLPHLTTLHLILKHHLKKKTIIVLVVTFWSLKLLSLFKSLFVKFWFNFYRDQTIYTQKFRGIFSVGKHRNSVGCVGIIFRRPPIFFTTLSVFIRFWCFLPFWNQETKPITLEINSRQLG